VRLSKCASEKWCNERKESAIFFFPFFILSLCFFLVFGCRRRRLRLLEAFGLLAAKQKKEKMHPGSPHALRRQNQNITAFFDYSQITNLKQEEDIEER